MEFDSLKEGFTHFGINKAEAIKWLLQSYRRTAGGKKGFEITATPTKIRTSFKALGLWNSEICNKISMDLPLGHDARTCSRTIGILTTKGNEWAEKLLSSSIEFSRKKLEDFLMKLKRKYRAVFLHHIRKPEKWTFPLLKTVGAECEILSVDLDWASDLCSVAVPDELRSEIQKAGEALISLDIGIQGHDHIIKKWRDENYVQLNPMSKVIAEQLAESEDICSGKEVIRQWVNFNRGNMAKLELIKSLMKNEVISKDEFEALIARYNVSDEFLTAFVEGLEELGLTSHPPKGQYSLALFGNLSTLKDKLERRIKEENCSWWEEESLPPIPDDLNDAQASLFRTQFGIEYTKGNLESALCKHCGAKLPADHGNRIVCSYCGLMHIIR